MSAHVQYAALEVAKYMITRSYQRRTPISNLAVQKLLYFAQRDYMSEGDGTPLFKDPIVAWKWGPVVSEVYYEFCVWGSWTILREYPVTLAEKDQQFLDKILTVYPAQNPWDLVDLTHKKGGPWDTVFNNGAGNKQTIPVDLIRKLG